jgi:hypothetical protein
LDTLFGVYSQVTIDLIYHKYRVCCFGLHYISVGMKTNGIGRDKPLPFSLSHFITKMKSKSGWPETERKQDSPEIETDQFEWKHVDNSQDTERQHGNVDT